MALERRTFMKLGGLAALGIASRAASGPTSGETPSAQHPAVDPDTGATPIVGRRLAMVVDVNACLRDEGCEECTAACHRVHNVPPFPNPKDEVKWIWKEPYVEALPDQRHDHLPAQLAEGKVLVFCNHCDVPPCTRVCPTGATWKREDGVVMMDWHRCIGCRYCVAACPYGSRSFNWRDPRPFLTSTDPAFPTRTRGVVEKCNLCEERLALGQLPACVEACPGKAIVFGDLEDPDSEVRQLLAERPAARRRPALGTQPQVYYLL
jgi:Fe-S-cluster-containing dehydrogenase component